jgi:hypothetical protein
MEGMERRKRRIGHALVKNLVRQQECPKVKEFYFYQVCMIKYLSEA